jgi:hypothetical protein
MKAEIDGDRFTVETGPGARQAALDNIAVYFRAREVQKTRRLLIVTAAVYGIVAAITVVFAPQGRELWIPWIGLALLVIATGAAGYSRFWLKTPEIEFHADQGDDSERNSNAGEKTASGTFLAAKPL